jgi:hypothetical protein
LDGRHESIVILNHYDRHCEVPSPTLAPQCVRCSAGEQSPE